MPKWRNFNRKNKPKNRELVGHRFIATGTIVYLTEDSERGYEVVDGSDCCAIEIDSGYSLNSDDLWTEVGDA